MSRSIERCAYCGRILITDTSPELPFCDLYCRSAYDADSPSESCPEPEPEPEPEPSPEPTTPTPGGDTRSVTSPNYDYDSHLEDLDAMTGDYGDPDIPPPSPLAGDPIDHEAAWKASKPTPKELSQLENFLSSLSFPSRSSIPGH